MYNLSYWINFRRYEEKHDTRAAALNAAGKAFDRGAVNLGISAI